MKRQSGCPQKDSSRAGTVSTTFDTWQQTLLKISVGRLDVSSGRFEGFVEIWTLSPFACLPRLFWFNGQRVPTTFVGTENSQPRVVASCASFLWRELAHCLRHSNEQSALSSQLPQGNLSWCCGPTQRGISSGRSCNWVDVTGTVRVLASWDSWRQSCVASVSGRRGQRAQDISARSSEDKNQGHKELNGSMQGFVRGARVVHDGEPSGGVWSGGKHHKAEDHGWSKRGLSGRGRSRRGAWKAENKSWCRGARSRWGQSGKGLKSWRFVPSHGFYVAAFVPLLGVCSWTHGGPWRTWTAQNAEIHTIGSHLARISANFLNVKEFQDFPRFAMILKVSKNSKNQRFWRFWCLWLKRLNWFSWFNWFAWWKWFNWFKWFHWFNIFHWFSWINLFNRFSCFNWFNCTNWVCCFWWF